MLMHWDTEPFGQIDSSEAWKTAISIGHLQGCFAEKGTPPVDALANKLQPYRGDDAVLMRFVAALRDSTIEALKKNKDMWDLFFTALWKTSFLHTSFLYRYYCEKLVGATPSNTTLVFQTMQEIRYWLDDSTSMHKATMKMKLC